MSQSSEGSDGSDGSDGRGRTPSPREPTVTLAKIFMIDKDNTKLDEWDGKVPKPEFKLFVYVTIGDTTYRGYFTKKKDSSSMRPGPYDPRKLQDTSFLHSEDGSIIFDLMRGNPTFTTANPSYCRIYKNNNTDDFWYKLYDYDDKPNTTEITKIRSVKKSKLGKPGVVNDGKEYDGKEYTPHCQYFPGEYLHLLFRETGLSSRPRTRIRPSSRSPLREGGGKTRRKCKVNKRRNRRRRNTMKRRKTTLKRRNIRK